MNFKGIFSKPRLLILIYAILVFLFSFRIESKIYQISYLVFSLLVGFLFFKFSKEKEEFKISKWLLVVALLIILISRIFPFLRSEVPLGYDAGLYKNYIESFAGALPGLPDFNSEIRAVKEPLGLYLITNLLYLIGFNTWQILFGFYILFDLLLGLGIYLLVRRFFNSNAALWAFFIFAISVTQFQTYWFLYYKQIVGIFLMLIALWLLKKKSYLAIPVAGFMGTVHPIPFFIFGLVLLLHFILNKNRGYHLISGVSILAISSSLYIYNFDIFLRLLPFLNPFLRITLPKILYGGRFFDFNVYIQLAAFYLLFAILGFIYLIQKRKFDYLFFWLLLNFLIVYLGFFFHNRFIPLLDIIVIILSGLILSQILNRIPKDFYTKSAVLIFFLGAIFFLFRNVATTKPSISQTELDEIRYLNTITEENAFVMSTVAHYSPWLYGFSNRKTIAPGMFEYDTKWSRKEWDVFWSTEDLEIRHKLLNRYEKPLYIFVGDRDPFELRSKFDKDPGFKKISERIYKYK